MPRPGKNKKYTELKERTVFVLKSLLTKECHVGYTLSHNMRSTSKITTLRSNTRPPTWSHVSSTTALSPAVLHLKLWIALRLKPIIASWFGQKFWRKTDLKTLIKAPQFVMQTTFWTRIFRYTRSEKRFRWANCSTARAVSSLTTGEKCAPISSTSRRTPNILMARRSDIQISLTQPKWLTHKSTKICESIPFLQPCFVVKIRI